MKINLLKKKDAGDKAEILEVIEEEPKLAPKMADLNQILKDEFKPSAEFSIEPKPTTAT